MSSNFRSWWSTSDSDSEMIPEYQFSESDISSLDLNSDISEINAEVNEEVIEEVNADNVTIERLMSDPFLDSIIIICPIKRKIKNLYITCRTD